MEALPKITPAPSAPPSQSGKPAKVGPLPIGTVLLGRYVLSELIAEGGTSYIYRAHDKLVVQNQAVDATPIVVKIVRPDLMDNEAALELLFCETITARTLSHPNIINIVDYYRDGNINFAIMEMIDGESLAEYMTRQRDNQLSLKQAGVIIGDVASALQAMHQQGLIHSDIKPSNILISNSGAVKLIDLATTRSVTHSNKPIAKGFKPGLSLASSATGGFHGYTLAYASRETIEDKPATPSDDVYSFACIIYEMLSGEHPYDRQSADKIADDEQPKKFKAISIWQWFVLKKALKLHAKQRFQSISQFMLIFNLAGKFWPLLIALSVVVAVLFGAGGSLKGQYDEDSSRALVSEQSYQAFENVESIVNDIRAEVLLSRPYMLGRLDNSPEILKQGALSQLHEDVVVALASHVEAVLRHNNTASELPNFKALNTLLSVLSAYYPASKDLEAAKRFVELEKMNATSSQLNTLNELWQGMAFVKQDVVVIKNLLERLTTLEHGDVAVPPFVLNRYQTAADNAVKDLDYIAVASLYQFAVSSKIYPQFLAIWSSHSAADLLEAAQSLIAYRDQSAINSNTEYPSLAKVKFVEPYFLSFNKTISNIWLDKDILSAIEVFKQGTTLYLLPAKSQTYQSLRQKITEKLTTKINYHKKKRNTNSLKTMSLALDELNEFQVQPISNTTPDFVIENSK
ncbi:MAG: serine/threonine protein kinase [Pseudohongiellaceae bacterium]